MLLDAEELRRLQEELASAEPARRESAVRRIAAMMEASAPELLIEALASDTREVRDHALRLLEGMAASGDPALQRVADAVRGVGPGA